MEENELITHYFYSGFSYAIILRLLSEYHDIHISRRSVFTSSFCMLSVVSCHRNSVCRLSVVSLSVVCNVRTPYSGD